MLTRRNFSTTRKRSRRPPDSAAKASGEAAKKGYVGIHSSGFRDFLLKPELLRAIVDSGFEHPSEVSAASDGLKAWKILKEKSHNIDLVLTEVDLPSISGFALLTMIMDHETCKNIPVIMMSSNDSMSMVFKCMLKGAADFLVKPIRKNELRNLWQHIWRKHILNGRHGGSHEHQDENMEKEKMDSHLREYETCTHENKECSEKGSDAQSSCTRLEMEDKLKENMCSTFYKRQPPISIKDDPAAIFLATARKMLPRRTIEVRSGDHNMQKWRLSLTEDTFDKFINQGEDTARKVFGEGSMFSPLLFGKFFDPGDAFPLWEFDSEILLSGLRSASKTSVDWKETDDEYVLRAELPVGARKCEVNICGEKGRC